MGDATGIRDLTLTNTSTFLQHCSQLAGMKKLSQVLKSLRQRKRSGSCGEDCEMVQRTFLRSCLPRRIDFLNKGNGILKQLPV